MLTLIRNAEVYSPEPLGRRDVLLAGGRIAAIDKRISLAGDMVEEVDAHGMWLLPGFVDPLTHPAGGGGEGGFANRTTELDAADFVAAGVTTPVGALGTDSITRGLEVLYGQVMKLRANGLSALMYSGSYRVPASTLTGDVARDLILVDHSGNVVYGTKPVNRAAFVIHAAVHSARPDVVAAAHAHSPYGKSFSSLGIPLAPLTQDACIFYKDHHVISEQGGAVVFDIEAGKELASKFPDGKAAIHQNHGLFTVGETVDEAAFWFISMERSCQAQLMAMAAGDPIEINDEYLPLIRERVAQASEDATLFTS